MKIAPKVLVRNVDIALLRTQRDTILELVAGTMAPHDKYVLNGVINLLDSMLDTAEGYDNSTFSQAGRSKAA